MKTLIQILLLALLAGCATPYYPVYVSSEGDYYIAERGSRGPYYGSGSVMFDDIGLYPWWVSAYPPQIFAYYSPYFYPHYFSVWYPPGFHPYFGFYGGYYAYWCPPYRIRRHHEQPDDNETIGSPVMPPVAYNGQPVANPELWRSIDRVSVNREIMHRRTIGQKAVLSNRTASPYTRSTTPSSVPASPAVSARSTGSSRSSGRSRSISRASRSPALHDQ
jgi:hypothetical protein